MAKKQVNVSRHKSNNQATQPCVISDMAKKQRKIPTVEADTSCFPPEITENILSRLPLKSLLRSKAVCKSWKATIEDPGFAKIHSDQLKMSNSQSFRAVGRYRHGKCALIKLQSHGRHVQSPVEFPSTEFVGAHFVCCCESTLVFMNETKFMLWNPFTRNYSSFPCPRKDLIPLDLGYGLCFDKHRDDYKLILALREGKYLVYSIKNDTWSERQTEYREFAVEGGTYVDGFVYWIVWGDVVDSIIYFDPEDDTLRELPRPTDLEDDQNAMISLKNLRGKLCSCSLDDSNLFRLWLLKESGGRKCWTKVTEIDPDRAAGDLLSDPLYTTIKNELVFHDQGPSWIFSSCPENKNLGQLPVSCDIIEYACLESLNFPAFPRESSS